MTKRDEYVLGFCDLMSRYQKACFDSGFYGGRGSLREAQPYANLINKLQAELVEHYAAIVDVALKAKP